MRRLGLRGVVLGCRTIPPLPMPPRRGFVQDVSQIDVCSRRSVVCRASTSIRAGFALNARKRSFCDGETDALLAHESNRGSRYSSIRYTERASDAGIEQSIGRPGHAYDTALAETIIGLLKTEVIY